MCTSTYAKKKRINNLLHNSSLLILNQYPSKTWEAESSHSFIFINNHNYTFEVLRKCLSEIMNSYTQINPETRFIRLFTHLVTQGHK